MRSPCTSSAKAELRNAAETKISGLKKKKAVPSPVTKADTLRLLHELEVHQIEVEMQNEHLVQAYATIEEAYHQYSDLYDFAPVGYIMMALDGTIRKMNLAGEILMGRERSKLVKRSLWQFISDESMATYREFFNKLLSGNGKETCELFFWKNNNEGFWARIEATCFEDRLESRLVMIDITERRQSDAVLQDLKQVEAELNRVNAALTTSHHELELSLLREQALSRTDGLTGLYNYLYFFELATREFDSSLRYQYPLSIIIFDSDNLKEINDSMGHQTGDRMISTVAQAASEQVRNVDSLARYGGDEFIILLPQTSSQMAFVIAERICTSVAALSIPTGKGLNSVTISIGVAEIQSDPADENVEQIVSRADKALYAAKQAGRNLTKIFDPQ